MPTQRSSLAPCLPLLLSTALLLGSACNITSPVVEPEPGTSAGGGTTGGNPGGTSGGQNGGGGTQNGDGGSQPGGQTPTGELQTPGVEAFEGTVGMTEKVSSGIPPVTLTNVRAGRHDQYDRVVFEFQGSALPGYHVEYIDRPVRHCASGDVVPLEGDGWLRIRLTPSQAHTEAGQATIAQREQRPGLTIVRELKQICDFEGQVAWVLGVSSPNRYRVLELGAPARLVVDIKH